jgi:flagellar hook assembly protein FlgD
LSNAHPNPSVRGSSVRLSLPAAADVVATVQDVAGRVVATIAHGRMSAGDHVIAWNPGADGQRKPAAGVYFIVVRALGEQRSSRVVLLP